MNIEIHKPELEALIQHRMDSGQFVDLEDVLLHGLKSSPATEPEPVAAPRKKSLASFLMNSPLRGSGLVVERGLDLPRPVDL